MLHPQTNADEFCAQCGEFVDYLNDETGWCNPCSGVTPCLRCDEPLNERAVGANERLCNRCKYLVWLETNADAIDRVMATQEISAAAAKRVIIQQNRPICPSCNNPIKGGTKGRHVLCTQTAKCRKAHNAYRYYRYQKGLPHNEALQRALTKATIFTLISEYTSN